MLLRLVILINLIFFLNSAISKETPVIVISAGKTPQTKSSVGSDIYLIDSNKISRSEHQFIGDIINQEIMIISLLLTLINFFILKQ